MNINNFWIFEILRINSLSKAATSTRKKTVKKIIIQLKPLEDLDSDPLMDGGKSLESKIDYVIDFGNSVLEQEDLSGYTITLYNSSNTALESKTCTSDGYFEFHAYRKLKYFIISKDGKSDRIELQISQIKEELDYYLDFV